MKNIFKTLMIMSLMIPCMLGMAACGNNGGNGNNGEKSWPTISYITNAEKYIGDGEISHVNSWNDGSCSIYINNSNANSISVYCTQLEKAGWTLSVGPVTGANNTAWGYTKDSVTCSIRLYSSTQTEERSSGNYSYNLYIGFENGSSDNGGDDNNGGQQNSTGVFSGYNIPTNFLAVWKESIMEITTTFAKVGDDYYLNIGVYTKTFWKKQSNETWKQYDWGVTDYDTDPLTYGWEASSGTMTASEVKNAMGTFFQGLIANSSDQAGASVSTENYSSYAQCRKYTIAGITTYLHSTYDICVAEIYAATGMTDEYSTTLETFEVITSFEGIVEIPQ